MVSEYIYCKNLKSLGKRYIGVCMLKCNSYHTCKAVQKVWFEAGYKFSRSVNPNDKRHKIRSAS